MEPYRYCLTVRIFHPSMNPDEITENIGIEPDTTRMVGDQRINPKGKLLEGVWPKSLWAYQPHKEERLFSNDQYLEDYISDLTNELSMHKEYFSYIVDTGGKIEYFVGLFSEYSIGSEFNPDLLRIMGELNIGLSLDIYAYNE